MFFCPSFKPEQHFWVLLPDERPGRCRRFELSKFQLSGKVDVRVKRCQERHVKGGNGFFPSFVRFQSLLCNEPSIKKCGKSWLSPEAILFHCPVDPAKVYVTYILFPASPCPSFPCFPPVFFLLPY